MSNNPDLIYRLEDCRDCDGSGLTPYWFRAGEEWDYETCLSCDGTGEVEVPR